MTGAGCTSVEAGRSCPEFAPLDLPTKQAAMKALFSLRQAGKKCADQRGELDRLLDRDLVIAVEKCEPRS